MNVSDCPGASPALPQVPVGCNEPSQVGTLLFLVRSMVATNPELEEPSSNLQMICDNSLHLSTAVGCGVVQIRWIHWLSEDRDDAVMEVKTLPLSLSRTSLRPQTFYDGSHGSARGVCHIPMAEPFCPKTREVCSVSDRLTRIEYTVLGWYL